jgi:hypothetical protein
MVAQDRNSKAEKAVHSVPGALEATTCRVQGHEMSKRRLAKL